MHQGVMAYDGLKNHQWFDNDLIGKRDPMAIISAGFTQKSTFNTCNSSREGFAQAVSDL
ncbi:MAG: hypothetical protein WCA07_10205 [Gloeobacterales cyanobacterium]